MFQDGGGGVPAPEDANGGRGPRSSVDASSSQRRLKTMGGTWTTTDGWRQYLGGGVCRT